MIFQKEINKIDEGCGEETEGYEGKCGKEMSEEQRDMGLVKYLCPKCQTKKETLIQCSKAVEEKINISVHNLFEKINWVSKNKGEIEPEDLDELKEELLSQLNKEDLKEKEG